MKLAKIISITLFLSICILLFISLGNTAFAGQYVSQQEAENMCPGISGMVNNLKNAHPGYNFQFYNTGIDWGEAILREYQGHGHSPSNLFRVSAKYSGMWFCPICGTKNFDNGLSCASMDALRYMMDPRNSISDDSVFQFKSLETPDVSYNDIVRVVTGTFLNNGECVQAILDASNTYGINGYYLVAKILTEQGNNGSTLSKGVIKDGVTYYNFFNIGASGNGKDTIIRNGTNKAAQEGWTSPRASIIGGTKFVKTEYIGKGQNTCYYQKFNVVDSNSLFSHQYAQNIMAAESEGYKIRDNYKMNGQIVGNHTFIIPIYANMSRKPEPRPSTATVNTINYEIAEVTANGGLKVRSRPDITSTHIKSIAQNTRVKVLMRTNIQSGGYYWDLMISDATGTCGYVPRKYIRTIGSGSSSGTSTPNEYIERLPVQSIKITGNIVVTIGKTISLKANISPINAYEQGVTWSSSNNSIATVDSNGKVTGKKMGNATITATAKDGSGVKGTFVVKVSDLNFSDVEPDKWYYNAVKYCSKNYIITGTSSTTFAPSDTLLRAMVVTILYRMEGEPAVSGATKFADVKDTSKWYYKAVKWATDKNIVNGYENGKFGPADPVTRQDLAIILYNYAKYKGKATWQVNDLSSFPDRNKVSSYALNQVKWAVGAGVITGNEKDKTLNPKGKSTRAEAAAMFEKYCRRIGR